MPRYWLGNGDACVWYQQAPYSQTVTINSPITTVTVTNTFACSSSFNIPPSPKPRCPEGQQDAGPSGAAGQQCVCPKDTKLKDGKCVKKSSGLNDLLNHVTIGVSVGGGGKTPQGDKGSPGQGEKGGPGVCDPKGPVPCP